MALLDTRVNTSPRRDYDNEILTLDRREIRDHVQMHCMVDIHNRLLCRGHNRNRAQAGVLIMTQQLYNIETINQLYVSHNKLLEALDYLLRMTVDDDVNHGIALTEGEQDASDKARAAIAQAPDHTTHCH